MFFPQLFGIVGEKLVYTKDHQYDDPEDLYDDRYLLEVRTCSAHEGVIHFPFFRICRHSVCFGCHWFHSIFFNDSLPQYPF